MTFTSPRLIIFFASIAVFAVPSCVDRSHLQTESTIAMNTATAEPFIIRLTEARAVVSFWRDAGPSRWFAKDPAFDARFRERFPSLHEAAARGELRSWERDPDGALALLILLDQYPRNSFRGTPRMYATDAMAREVADRVIASGVDRLVEPRLRTFVYLPFGHSESLADQDRSVALAATISETEAKHAQHHRDIVARFGRFPHRNPILGRTMRPEEQDYLDNGGYAG
jgi:uncharacterized protein (DUF924 family)